jgi:hypothetical protein
MTRERKMASGVVVLSLLASGVAAGLVLWTLSGGGRGRGAPHQAAEPTTSPALPAPAVQSPAPPPGNDVARPQEVARVPVDYERMSQQIQEMSQALGRFNDKLRHAIEEMNAGQSTTQHADEQGVGQGSSTLATTRPADGEDDETGPEVQQAGRTAATAREH